MHLKNYVSNVIFVLLSWMALPRISKNSANSSVLLAFWPLTLTLTDPDSASWGQMMSHNGFSVRVIKDYDVNNDIEICRLDVMWGAKTLYPELACRLTD